MSANETHEYMIGDSRVRAHVRFDVATAPNLSDLVHLLEILQEESNQYKLLSVSTLFYEFRLEFFQSEYNSLSQTFCLRALVDRRTAGFSRPSFKN